MAEIIINVDYTTNYAAAPANGEIACVVTAKTFPELQAEMESSLREHIAWMKRDGDTIPEEFQGEWSFKWNLSVRAMLHYTEGLVSRAAIAKAAGVNQQQLTHYASGYRSPRLAMRRKIQKGLNSIVQQLSILL